MLEKRRGGREVKSNSFFSVLVSYASYLELPCLERSFLFRMSDILLNYIFICMGIHFYQCHFFAGSVFSLICVSVYPFKYQMTVVTCSHFISWILFPPSSYLLLCLSHIVLITKCLSYIMSGILSDCYGELESFMVCY